MVSWRASAVGTIKRVEQSALRGQEISLSNFSRDASTSAFTCFIDLVHNGVRQLTGVAE